jgi:hypothetical protein
MGLREGDLGEASQAEGSQERPDRTRNQREESQGGARENKELEPERTRAGQRARQKQKNGCKLTVSRGMCLGQAE